jgi:hypothetical protein
MKNKPLIIWEKWKDPFGADEDEENIGGDWDSDNEESVEVMRSKVLVTPMGLIPFSENTNASKIFKFWLAHTNFTITENIVNTIESIEGVETLDIYTRYRFRISVGKGFNDRDVMSDINSVLYSYIEQKNDTAIINT